MELTFNQLKKRDVINVADGKSLGKIVDLKLSFPQGKLSGIFVPGRRAGFFSRLFDKSTLYVDESRIVKIGGDVVLVNLRSAGECSESKLPPCPPPCQPCPPFPPHKKPPKYTGDSDLSIISGGDERIDTTDY